MSDFSFFVPITKVSKQEDGSCLVSGYCSTPALDLDGEVVSLDAIKKAAPGYWEWRNIRRMHSNDAVGVGKELNIDGNGAFLTAKITQSDAVKGVLEGVYKGFSIGGRKLAKKGNTITEIDWVETSIVDRPANPECKFEVAKRAKDGAGAFLVKAAPSGQAQLTKALAKMARAAEILAKAPGDPPADHDGFSLPANHAASAKCIKHGLANCAKCAMKAAKKTKKTAGTIIEPDKLSDKAAKFAAVVRDVEGGPDIFFKRKFDEAERRAAARTGAAMDDGSFPIYNAKDLKNAIRLAGHGANPAKAKEHIKSRAQALGLSHKIPADWSGENAAKGAKKAARVALATKIADGDLNVDAARGSFGLPVLAEEPSFLTLDVAKKGSARPLSGDGVELGHGLDLVVRDSPRKDGDFFSKRERKMIKRMGVAGSLSYCFDSVREAQRSLLWEAKREGGDMKDRALALKLGSVAQALAAVIGQKAEHEGQEALDFSDADDQGYDGNNVAMEILSMSKGNDDLTKALVQMVMNKRSSQPTRAQRMEMAKKDLKKARDARKECAVAIKAAGAVLKAAYIAKAAELAKVGKKPEDDEDEPFSKAIAHLQKAYGAIEKVGTFSKAASEQLKKAARTGQRGQSVEDGEGGVYEVPAGVRTLSQDELVTAGPGTGERGSMPHPHDLMNPYPDAGKSAKGQRAAMVTASEAEAMAKAAALEAENALLKSMPMGGGRRPYAFDMTRGGATGFGSGAPDDPTMALLRDPDLTKGVNVRDIASSDEGTHNRALGAVIGNMIIKGKGAKSVFDDKFHGTVGGSA